METKKIFTMMIFVSLLFSGSLILRKTNFQKYFGAQVSADDSESGDSEDSPSSSSGSSSSTSSSSSAKPKTETIQVPAVTATVPVIPQYTDADLSGIISALNIYVTFTQTKIDELYFQGSADNGFTDSLNQARALMVGAQAENDAAVAAEAKITDPNNSIAGLTALLQDVKNKKSDAADKFGQVNQQLDDLNKSIDAALEKNRAALDSLDDSGKSVSENYKNISAQLVRSLLLVSGRHTADPQLPSLIENFKTSSESVAIFTDKLTSASWAKEFFLGADYTSGIGLKNELGNNEQLLQAVADVINGLQDQAAQIVISQQVALLNGQYEKLQQLVDSKENEPSVFGWSSRMLIFFQR